MAKMLGFFMLISLLMGVVSLQMQGAQGGVATTTTATLTPIATNAVGVLNTNGFKGSGRMVIRTEILRYSGKGAAGTCPAPIPVSSPCFTNLTRSVAGSTAATYLPGTRVYDEVAGYANLGSQYQTLSVQNELEQAGRITLNPLSWGHMIEQVIVADQQFLQGNWRLLMIPWYAFTVTFLFGLALAMAGLIRTVFLR
jgi:hypothetical protein